MVIFFIVNECISIFEEILFFCDFGKFVYVFSSLVLFGYFNISNFWVYKIKDKIFGTYWYFIRLLFYVD